MKFLGLLAVAMMLAAAPLPAHAAKHALLIGIADYGGKRDLDGTINDVELVKGMLKERFGFKDSEITMLKNAQATHTGLKEAFAALNKRVGKDDFVYIHYSGHGSYTPDLNGDERVTSVGGVGYDSTWVSYGVPLDGAAAKPATRDAKVDLDAYGVLDDELAGWLDPIYRKTGNVAFVSDSCHSGTITRGGPAPKVRATPVDVRPHPLGKAALVDTKQAGVQISAARDDQEAGEFVSPEGKSYGLFTWHWVQAMYRASANDTWDDLFKRTSALIGSNRVKLQHPQIRGEKNRSVFAGDFKVPSPTIAVSSVSDDGREVTIKLGSFLGMTEGSTFRIAGGDASFMITAVSSFFSTGKVTTGKFKQGDLVIEETHVYKYTPMKVFVRALSPEDNALAASLRNEVANVPGYAMALSQKEADLLLAVIRPLRKDGALEKAQPGDTLPKTDPTVKPEIWLLTADELPTRENLQLKPDSDKRAVTLLKENLGKMAKIRDLRRLGTDDNAGAALVELQITRFTPDDACTAAAPVCKSIEDGPLKGHHYRRMGVLTPEQAQGAEVRQGDLLCFSVKNKSSSNLYIYLLDILPDHGSVEPFLPDVENDAPGDALVMAGTERDFGDITVLRIDKPGEDVVKLIASEMMIDPALFRQGQFITRSVKKGNENPLEAYLVSVSQGQTRSGMSVSRRNSKWGTLQFSVESK